MYFKCFLIENKQTKKKKQNKQTLYPSFSAASWAVLV